MKSLILAFFLFISQYAFSQSLVGLQWMLGSWQKIHDDPNKVSFENWELISKDEMQGIGFSLNGSDTVFVERLKIIQLDSGVFYVANVANNKGPVYFKMIDIGPRWFTCQNPRHDFPKEISYNLDFDSFEAIISNESKSVTFKFKRVE